MITWSIAIVLVSFIIASASLLHSWLANRHKREKMKIKQRHELDKEYLEE